MIVQPKAPRRLFHDAAYQERAFPALRLARTVRLVRRVARWVLILLILAGLSMVFVPWQQTAAGTGVVVAYDPTQRHQSIDAPIKGRVVNWQDNCYEGARVKEGDLLFEIEVVDRMLRDQVEQQLRSTQQKLRFDQQIVMQWQQQVDALKESRRQIITAAEQAILAAEQKVAAEEEQVHAEEASYEQLRIDAQRRRELYEKKVETEFNAQLAERNAATAQRKLNQAKKYVEIASRELDVKKAELQSKSQEAQAKIDAAIAYLQKAEGDVQNTLKEIADIQQKLTLQKQPVKAPRDGFIYKMHVAQEAQIVSEGAPLVELVPATADRAVALKIHGNDVVLVASPQADGQPRKVRLQFEAWPSVQFSGWPSIAVGTFGGIIQVVDQTDDGTGKFRVLVTPDPEDPNDWPSQDFLRQGTRAMGWVLLNEVPLGQEIWRQMNGFPPTVDGLDARKFEEKLLRSKK